MRNGSNWDWRRAMKLLKLNCFIECSIDIIVCLLLSHYSVRLRNFLIMHWIFFIFRFDILFHRKLAVTHSSSWIFIQCFCGAFLCKLCFFWSISLLMVFKKCIFIFMNSSSLSILDSFDSCILLWIALVKFYLFSNFLHFPHVTLNICTWVSDRRRKIFWEFWLIIKKENRL